MLIAVSVLVYPSLWYKRGAMLQNTELVNYHCMECRQFRNACKFRFQRKPFELLMFVFGMCSICQSLKSTRIEFPMEHLFQKQKQQTLVGADLSRKGSIDVPIRELVDFLNKHEAFVTTSSCSGRVIVYEQNPDSSGGKQGCRWLYTTHEECKTEDVMAALSESQGDAYFKFEPFILHVQCCTLEDAQKLLADAVASGFKNSGLSVSKKGKIMAAVRSTHTLEAPVTCGGNLLVSQQYIEFLVKIATEKMDENMQRISRFTRNIRNTLMDKANCSTPQNSENVQNKSGLKEVKRKDVKASTTASKGIPSSTLQDEDVGECLDGLYEHDEDT